MPILLAGLKTMLRSTGVQDVRGQLQLVHAAKSSTDPPGWMPHMMGTCSSQSSYCGKETQIKKGGLQKEGAALVRWVLNMHWGTHSSCGSLTWLLATQPLPLGSIPLETQGQGELMCPNMLVQYGDEIQPGCTPWTAGVSQTHGT